MTFHVVIALLSSLIFANREPVVDGQLKLDVGVASKRYCTVDDEITSLRIKFKTALANVGPNSIRVNPPFHPRLLISRTLEDLRKGKYEFKLYGPDLIHRSQESTESVAANDAGSHNVDLRPGQVFESETMEISIPTPRTSHFSKMEALPPGEHYIQALIEGRIGSTQRVVRATSEPIKIYVDQNPQIQTCR